LNLGRAQEVENATSQTSKCVPEFIVADLAGFVRPWQRKCKGDGLYCHRRQLKGASAAQRTAALFARRFVCGGWISWLIDERLSEIVLLVRIVSEGWLIALSEV